MKPIYSEIRPDPECTVCGAPTTAVVWWEIWRRWMSVCALHTETVLWER